MAKKRGYRTVTLQMAKKNKKLKLYTSERVSNAAQEIAEKLETLYYFARLGQVLEAVHEHGRKEGRREVFVRMDALKGDLPHALPGRPRRHRPSN